MKEKTLVVTANDVQKDLADILEDKGLNIVRTEYFDKSTKQYISDCKNIILPFPTKADKFTFIADGKKLGDFLDENQCVIGGLLSDEVINEIVKSGAEYIDYFKNESYVLKNAFITSQGALRLLLEATDDFLVGKKVLITGFGRIGKSLAFMLKALGMKVFVAARSKKALTEAFSSGFEVFSISQMYTTLFYYDFIFNTVPEIIFEKNHIKHIRDDAYYFELASYPYGANKLDFEAEGKMHINGNALPGRFFPRAIAENIAEFYFLRGGD